MVHRAGWKAIGALYAEGKLRSDFDGNEKPQVTAWYVPTALRLSRTDPDPCGSKPHYYFVADRLELTSDEFALEPSDLVGYAKIGRVELPNGHGITIYEIAPAGPEIGRVDALTLSRHFDRQATPALFMGEPQPSQKVNANFGGLIQLTGYDVRQSEGTLVLTLFWKVLQAPSLGYKVFVHVEGGLGGTGSTGVWGQSDGVPACYRSPTQLWAPGDKIVDRHIVSPAPEAPAGSYSLVVGLYRPDTGERLPVLDEAGSPIGDQAVLETVALPLEWSTK
jgi:hypothetical protein